jgi:putative DNA primase/helicase
MTTIFDLARAACERAGIEYKTIPTDGAWHCANLINDHRGKGDARIRIFPDLTGGAVWNHKTGQSEQFFTNTKPILTQTDRAKIEADKQRRQVQIEASYGKAASRARFLWQHGAPITEQAQHPYLVAKNVNPPPKLLKTAPWKRRIKDEESGQWRDLIIKNTLLVPLYTETGELLNLQGIFPKKVAELNGRNKDFLPGGRSSGLFCWIGQKSTEVCIAEGLATALSIHEATGFRVYVAFSAGNLKAVGLIVRKHLPDTKIIFCADNDNSGTGQTKATDAALAVDGYVCAPPTTGDFNDYINMDEATHG